MDWLLIALGVLLVCGAIGVVRIHGPRSRLPQRMQDEMMFGQLPPSVEERAFVQRHLYYGVNSAQFLAVVLGAAGIGLLFVGFGMVP